MSSKPADSPKPFRPILRWRHRRRPFYLAAAIVPMALLWGGWVWWYRANFPVPLQGVSTVANVDVKPLGNWLKERRNDLLFWKIAPATRQFSIQGTIWMCIDRNRKDLIMTFGDDLRLSMKLSPGAAGNTAPNLLLSPFSSQMKAPRAEVERFYADLDGRPYRYISDSTWPSWGEWKDKEAEPNLLLADSPWQGFLMVQPNTNDGMIVVYFRSGDGKTTTRFTFIRVRTPAASSIPRSAFQLNPA